MSTKAAQTMKRARKIRAQALEAMNPFKTDLGEHSDAQSRIECIKNITDLNKAMDAAYYCTFKVEIQKTVLNAAHARVKKLQSFMRWLANVKALLVKEHGYSRSAESIDPTEWFRYFEEGQTEHQAISRR